MPSTHLSLHYHLVFSTRNREPLIAEAWRSRLHAYLGGTMRTLNGIAEEIGGTADHVHLLIGLRATHCLADALREIKAKSSHWVHDQMGLRSFSWQEGYGAFTVSASQRQAVRDYIRHQEAHHRRHSFQEEYKALLERQGVEYEEKHLW